MVSPVWQLAGVANPQAMAGVLCEKPKRPSLIAVRTVIGADAPNTLITLNPGDWLRVEANVHFNLKLPPAGTINLEPAYWSHRVTFYPHPGGSSTAIDNVCINRERSTPTVRVHRD